MDLTRLLATRLHSQHLHDSSLQTPQALVTWLGAVQSQEFHHAKWALGVRLPGITEADVDRAIANREIARTWVMRGTLHLVPGADLRWLVALTSAANQAKTRPLHKKLELDAHSLDLAVDAMCGALAGGKALERKDLLAAVEAAGISAETLRGAFMLYEAAHRGHICLGPMRGKQDTYVLVEEWLPPGPLLDREAGIAMLARRYFQSHGPANLQDFVWWSGLPVREARQGLEACLQDLEQVNVEGVEHWMGSQAAFTEGPSTLLLPGFDEYLIAYRDRTTILQPAHLSKVITANGIFRPIVVVGGKVAGTWQRGAKGGQIAVEVEGLSGEIPLTDALRAQMEAYERFVQVV